MTKPVKHTVFIYPLVLWKQIDEATLNRALDRVQAVVSQQLRYKHPLRLVLRLEN